MCAAKFIIRTIDELRQRFESEAANKNILVAGICGLAGAGKTTLCRQLTAISGFNIVHLSCDRFSSHSYADRQASIESAYASGITEHIAFAENPQNWYAYDDIIAAIHALRAHGHYSYNRAWNGKTGNLDEHYNITLSENAPSIVLCDGIYLLHEPISTALDIIILVDTPVEVTVQRGQKRVNDNTDHFMSMERLRQTYTMPYFEALSGHADILFQPESAPSDCV
ncbi:uridine kinase [Pseudochrobactrum saccharolyticum]|uniref:Uridine kinase n=1 Tax=Pseudochrobactrum saccharolyticum TaxID=354352 RepID=A0A7W8AJ74_9HYPH|nr:hypothetical protein [Pseudochrobactrum saccharolyticum]KAB0539107.1 hypothetical protein F7P81_08665 [Pseudochrobactrum saccharolyticum]MBB5090879.1 uridine kinase [Pseudochrobactrum saccharolyticum]